MNRRSFLAAGVALPFAWRSLAEGFGAGAGPAAQWIFLGTDKGDGVYRASWNAKTGEVGAIELAAATKRTTFLARHPKLDMLFAANEYEQGNGAVSALKFGKADGSLQSVAKVDSLGKAPCFVVVRGDGSAVLAANYGSGSVACFGLDARGAFVGKGQAVDGKFAKVGPNAQRQGSSHMHCAVPSADGKLVFACDLGSDAIRWYGFEGGPAHEPVTIVEKGAITVQAGDGPRHLAWHPNGRWLYCINELGCVVTRFDWEGTKLVARPEFRTSTLVGYDGPSVGADGIPCTAAEIVIDGGFLYATTRGADVMAVYAVDGHSGKLAHVQTISVHGRIPRHFAVSPDGRFLLSANQGTNVAGTDSLAVFRRDVKTGKLEFLKSYAANTPMFVQFV